MSGVDVVRPLYYMRDNHTFKRLSDDAGTAMKEIEECFDSGASYGTLCTNRKGHGIGSVHANGPDKRREFLAAASKWLEAHADALSAKGCGVDTLAVLTDYSAQHGEPDDMKSALAAVAELVAAARSSGLYLDAYYKASQSAQPADWMDAALLAKQWECRITTALAAFGGSDEN